MNITPYNDKKFAVRNATKHNHVLKDKFGASFKEGNLYAWLVDMCHLESVIAEFPDITYTSELLPNEELIQSIRWQRNLERASNLIDTLWLGGYVVIDTGTRLRIWGPEENYGDLVRNMKGLERRLNELREWVLLVVYGEDSEEDADGDEMVFVPRQPSPTLSDVHWKGAK